MEDRMITFALLAAATATMPVCDNKPVLLVVSGRTIDRPRMLAYGKAIAESRIYEKLGGYYLNSPAALVTLEGSPPPGASTIIVRFPCRANAEAFWHSEVYQKTILPMRLNPSAGDYLIQIFPEVPVRADMVEKVGRSDYRISFPSGGIAQAKP
jgi:uncharacterized protein (DUF1330 family)